MKRRPKRATEIFTLSFLDCLCCGFGAVLLLFLLTIGRGEEIGGPNDESEAEIRELRTILASVEDEVRNKALLYAEAVDREQSLIARSSIQSEIEEIESLLAAVEREVEELREILNARQQEIAAADRLLRSFPFQDMPPIGLPTDATHVAFVIDTSGSMRNQLTGQMHPRVIAQISYVLENLPQVRFIQFLDTSGNYMLSEGRGVWLRDTPAMRNQAQHFVRNYAQSSDSDPERGMRRAFRDLRPPLGADDRMSLFIFGDDVRRTTATLLIATDNLNPRDPRTGDRAVTINAIAFPMLIRGFNLNAVDGSTRFANVMREIVADHGGVLILSHL